MNHQLITFKNIEPFDPPLIEQKKEINNGPNFKCNFDVIENLHPHSIKYK